MEFMIERENRNLKTTRRNIKIFIFTNLGYSSYKIYKKSKNHNF